MHSQRTSTFPSDIVTALSAATISHVAAGNILSRERSRVRDMFTCQVVAPNHPAIVRKRYTQTQAHAGYKTLHHIHSPGGSSDLTYTLTNTLEHTDTTYT